MSRPATVPGMRPVRRAGRPRVAAWLLGGALVTSGTAAAADTCSVSVSGVNFGVYSPLSGSAANSTGNVLVNCSWTAPAPTQISLVVDFSTGSSNSYANRTMTNGSGGSLSYNLYFIANGTEIWGNGTGGTLYGIATLTTGTPTGSASASGTIYAIAPAGQDVPPGSYADTIVVTVNY